MFPTINNFLHPERLWLLLVIPVLLVAYVVLLRRKALRSHKFGIDNLDRVLPKQAAWKRHIGVVAACASLASLNVAFAQPNGQVAVPRQRATVVVAIDVSKSMAADDIDPTRLDAAKVAAGGFIDMLPSGFNVSVVSFAAYATIVVPPTTDRGQAKAAVDNLQLAPSTAIGDGIYSSLDALALVPADPQHPNDPTPGAIVLLSDGQTNNGRPSASAAQAAKKANTPVYTIAYGTPTGSVVTNGRRELVPVDKAELANIARLSGGQAFSAGSTSELKAAYESIARSVGYEMVNREITEVYAGYALALAALAALAVMSLAARWP